MISKTIKPSKAGLLFGSKGYLMIGLERYDVKIKKATDEQRKSDKAPEFRLVQYDRKDPKFTRDICGLFQCEANGKIFFEGSIEVGFGIMNITIWQIAEENRKSAKSPTAFIKGKLQMEKIGYDEEEEDNPFGNKTKKAKKRTEEEDDPFESAARQAPKKKEQEEVVEEEDETDEFPF